LIQYQEKRLGRFLLNYQVHGPLQHIGRIGDKEGTLYFEVGNDERYGYEENQENGNFNDFFLKRINAN